MKKKSLRGDPTRSAYLRAPSLCSGGGGLVTTAADYLRFARMPLGGGIPDGLQILSPETIALMTLNHLPDGKDLQALSRSLFSEVIYNGVGFGLGSQSSSTRDSADAIHHLHHPPRTAHAGLLGIRGGQSIASS